MARSQATLIFTAALVVNVLLLSQSRLTNVAVQQRDAQDFVAGMSLFRRGLSATDLEGSGENVRPYSLIRSPWFPPLIKPPNRSVFAFGVEPIDIISVDPPNYPSKTSAHMSRKNVQNRIPSSRSRTSGNTSAPNQKLDHGPSRVSLPGSYSSSRRWE
jgi:hypothetical protein